MIKMNKSHFEHALIAVILQVIFGLLTSNWFYGVFLAFGMFWSREHTSKQHDIAERDNVKLKELKPWEGTNIFVWSEDSRLDFIVPFVVTSINAWTVHTFFF